MKKKIVRIISLIAAGVLSGNLLSCSVFEKLLPPVSTKPVTLPVTDAQTNAPDVELSRLAETAMSTENYRITGAMLSYLYHYNLTSFVYQNYYSLSSLGLTLSKPLKQQSCKLLTDGTWHDYFISSAKQSAENILLLCEASADLSLSLSEADLTEIEDELKKLESYAKEAGMTAEEYIASSYGSGVTLEDLRSFYHLATLSNLAYAKLMEGYTFSSGELEAYREENKDSFYGGICFFYGVSADYEEDADEKTVKAARQEAYKSAQELAAADSDEAFLNAVNALREKDEDDPLTLSSLTQEVLSGDDTDLAKWLFTEGRQAGETMISGDPDKDDDFMVFRVSKPYLVLDDYRTVNVRHVLFLFSSFKTEDEAKARAEELLAEFERGDRTREAFAALAEQYSEDPGSQNNGGLYENVCLGDMVEPFESWCFDPSRTEGDTGIVKTSYGYHVMFLDGFGMKKWELTAKNELTAKRFDADYAALKEAHPITSAEELIDLIGD